MHLVDQGKALRLKLGCVNFHLTSLGDQACIASKVRNQRLTQPLRVLRASLFSPYYSSDRAILDGLIRAGFEIRKKPRTVATVGTEDVLNR